MLNNNRLTKLKSHSLFISCVVPVYNEEAGLSLFVDQLKAQLQQVTNHYEIIIVDDGSKDHTLSHATSCADPGKVKIIGLSRNFGKEIALTAGIEHAQGDVVILLDADFQHPVEYIPTFLEYWGQGYDMVYGVRKHRASESYIKRNASHFFYWIMQKITKINIPKNAGDFRLMDRSIVDALSKLPERTRFMKGLYAWVGYKNIGIPFDVQERKAGKSSWGFGRLTELAITGITSFSDVPLRVWSFFGFVISTIAFIYAVYIITVTLLYGTDLPGFPTLVVAIMFLGGIQLLSIGILGEYIARIFTEVKQRPKYLIREKIGFDHPSSH